jgi:hypothetical protein
MKRPENDANSPPKKDVVECHVLEKNRPMVRIGLWGWELPVLDWPVD